MASRPSGRRLAGARAKQAVRPIPQPSFGFVTPQNMALLVDLYELVMADSYWRQEMNRPATFDLFVRDLPPHRSFLLSAGLESALYYLEHVTFTEPLLGYLRTLGVFSDPFLEYLRGFRFNGDVRAIPEGEVFFPPEPLLEITAPRIEAQLVETFLLNTMNFQVMVASKAARVVLAAQHRAVVDYSPRRDHGSDAAMKAARASYLAGCVGTSNVLAGMEYGIPVYGTMAHSYVMSFPDELGAFRALAHDFPNNAIFLIDTYDIHQGAQHAIQVAKEMAAAGQRLRGVRIDSGDLVAQSRSARALLDAAGLPDVQIVLSGELDEYKIADLLSRGAAADSFGVGTAMGTSEDAPTMGGIYKLVEDEAGPKVKLSAGKVTLPGRKQVWRRRGTDGSIHDTMTLADEPAPEGARPMLVAVMERGKSISPPTLGEIRSRCQASLTQLPPSLKDLRQLSASSVAISDKLQRLQRTVHHLDISGGAP